MGVGGDGGEVGGLGGVCGDGKNETVIGECGFGTGEGGEVGGRGGVRGPCEGNTKGGKTISLGAKLRTRCKFCGTANEEFD